MVLGDAVTKLQNFVWLFNHVSRVITWSLFNLRAPNLVKWLISTWPFIWWCQFIDLNLKLAPVRYATLKCPEEILCHGFYRYNAQSFIKFFLEHILDTTRISIKVPLYKIVHLLCFSLHWAKACMQPLSGGLWPPNPTVPRELACNLISKGLSGTLTNTIKSSFNYIGCCSGNKPSQ